MKSDWDKFIVWFVIISSIFHFETAQAQTTVSQALFTYDDTDFELFYTSPDINQPNAQTECLVWGGNLATIKSAVEDSLLLYSSPDLDTIFTCHIGLNDIDTEAGTNGDDFVWTDDSTSSYRKWGTIGMDYPISTVNYDCVRNRYRVVVLSQGWVNDPCTQERNCYYCSKSGTSNGCDLIYDGFCYKVFEVSTPINWLDSQSSCAIWGGDLTSITTERENNYLNTLITSSVGNCWIGLNDRSTEGTYTWIDGTAVSYTNWTSTPPDDTNSDCVQINNAGNGIWESVSCDITLNAILCKRDSSSTIPTVGRFGRITNGAYGFEALTGNTFFYEPLTLVCGSDGSPVVWRYSQNSSLSGASILLETSNYVDFSWLDVSNTIQGYYQCMIVNGVSRIIGLYDQSLTTVAESGSTYNYTVGIDRVDALLLCNPNDNSIPIASLMWGIEGAGTWTNPINISEWSSTSLQQVNQLNCLVVGSVFISVTANLYVPTLTVSTTESSTQFSAVYPANNTISLKVRTVDFSLSANLPGRWKLPNDTFTSEQSISYQTLDYQYFGLYQYLIINWDGNEVIAIQITLIRDGFVVTDSISISNAPIQNDSTIVVTEESTMIDCAVSSLSDNVQWIFKSQTDGMITDKTFSATFSMETGLSTLVVTANEPGDYSCIINAQSVYSFSVVNENSLVRIDSFANPPQQVNFTVNSPVSQLYYPSSAITQVSVSDSDIQWTNDVVENGDDKSYTTEYPNPVDLNTVFSNVGGGLQTFSCFYRMSPVTLLGSVQLVLRDTATITVSYQTSSTTFSDVDNPMFPSAQEIIILIGTTDVMLTCSLSKCIWLVSDPASVITTQTYTIPAITDSYNVNISLMRMTATSVTYTTAHITITSMSSPQTQSSVTAIAAIIIVIVLFAVIAVIFTLLLICFFVKKRKSRHHDPKTDINEVKIFSPKIPKNTNSDDIHLQDFNQTKQRNPNYEDLSGIPSNDCIQLQTDPNRQYMTIDESSMMSLESKYQQQQYDNQNLVNAPISNPISSMDPSLYVYMDVSETENDTTYGKYMPMGPLKEEKKFIPKFIPVKQFPALYQQYAASGIDKDSLLSVEFTSLNEESQINVDPPSNEASITINIPKNPFINIIPFDENRVILDSQHFDCNYINASWVESYQFIATIHPNKVTHRDFLQMIYQTEASMVIMLTTRREKAKIIGGVSNRVCYWPKKDESIDCEPFVTTLINSTETTAFVKQEISLKNTLEGKEHTFTQCISPVWNEDSTVVEIPSAVALLSRILKQLQDVASKPIIIHCEDGISKTGIILAGINSVKELTLKKTINIFNTVKNLRKQRMKMVPTLACYTTCYSLMNEYCSIHL